MGGGGGGLHLTLPWTVCPFLWPSCPSMVSHTKPLQPPGLLARTVGLLDWRAAVHTSSLLPFSLSTLYSPSPSLFSFSLSALLTLSPSTLLLTLFLTLYTSSHSFSLTTSPSFSPSTLLLPLFLPLYTSSHSFSLTTSSPSLSPSTLLLSFSLTTLVLTLSL